MKANAPERVYCESDGLGNIVTVHNIKWPGDEAENIEYTRTDSFIEKSWSWMEDNLLTSNQQDKAKECFEQFKKAMML